jgi:DeoR/GlpR family transcriptional regulator of sugar metabolism
MACGHRFALMADAPDAFDLRTVDALSSERRLAIARLVDEHGRVRVGALSERFGVSRQTIRKDLAVLAAQGRITRAHGGAISFESRRSERSFDIREHMQRAEKAAIGAVAATRVNDGECIAIDASTTGLHLARALRARGSWNQLTVVTNGLRIASELAGCHGIAVVLPGGWVRWEALSVVGSIGAGVFDRINVQTAFVGAAGFTFEAGLSDATEEEAQIKRSMVEAAGEVVAIIDHTKWGHTAFATFCRTDELTSVISDRSAPEPMVSAPEARGIQISLVPSATVPAIDGVCIRSSEVDRDPGRTPVSPPSLLW